VLLRKDTHHVPFLKHDISWKYVSGGPTTHPEHDSIPERVAFKTVYFIYRDATRLTMDCFSPSAKDTRTVHMI
jgi:hypothetical protein